MEQKPEHPDIKKFAYTLAYSKSRDKWYAAYDTDCKGAAWYAWNGKGFSLMSRLELPSDIDLFI